MKHEIIAEENIVAERPVPLTGACDVPRGLYEVKTNFGLYLIVDNHAVSLFLVDDVEEFEGGIVVLNTRSIHCWVLLLHEK